MASNGGSSSAVQTLPAYIKKLHYQILTNIDASDPDTASLPGQFAGTDLYASYMYSNLSPVLTSNNPFSTGYTNPGGGVLTPVALSDPTSLFTDMTDRYSTWETMVDGLDEGTDFGAMFGDAVTEADVADRLKALGIDTLFDGARSEADDEHAAAKAQKATGIVETTQWGSFADAVKTKAGEVGFLTSIDFSAITSAARTGSTNALADALTAAVTGLNELTSWDAMIDATVAKLKECGVLRDIDVPSLFNLALSSATREIEYAINAANDALADELLTPVVDGYRQRAQYQKQKSVRILTGQMADVGAHHSSAFLISLALIESQHLADVDRFDAELTLQTYNSLLNLHGGVLTTILGQAIQAWSANTQARTAILSQALSNMVELRVNDIRFRAQLADLFGGIHGQQVQANALTEQTNKSNRDRLILESTQVLASMWAQKVQYERHLLELHKMLYTEALDKKLNAAVIEKRARDGVIQLGIQQQSQMLSQRLSMTQNTVSSLAELKRLRYVGLHEWEGNNWDLRAKMAMWPITVTNEAIKTLVAPAGMAGTIPIGPSRTATTLGGAFQGAAAGAMTGSAFGPIGAAIGGGIGLLLGGTAGYFSA